MRLNFYGDWREPEEYDGSEWELIDRKSVLDSDGFYTDYSLYYNEDGDYYVTVFGDSDIYHPEDGNFDAEFDSESEALEWFDSYTGFDDTNDDERYEVNGYYDSKYYGLSDDFKSNDWSEIEDHAHDMLSHGYYVEIIDFIAGNSVRLDPDSYFDGFEGEFPIKPWDLDENWK